MTYNKEIFQPWGGGQITDYQVICFSKNNITTYKIQVIL